MATIYGNLCDDFYVDMNATTQLELGGMSRETLLSFFQRIQRAFPGLRRFRRRDNGDVSLEDDKEGEGARWVSLEPRQLRSGINGPESIEAAVDFHRFVLDAAPSYLTLGDIDVESVDLLFGFEFNFAGNHDELISDVLLTGSLLGSLLDVPGAKPLEFRPALLLGLDEDRRLQARLQIETQSTPQQVRSGEYRDDPISVLFYVRQEWAPGMGDAFADSLTRQARTAEDLLNAVVLPKVLQPISQAIGTRG
jgi:hypothetical protein